MSQQYRLPCACGQEIPVSVSQAGGSVACACGAKITVPTLGALRQLPSSNNQSASLEAAPWNATRGAMFAGGVLVILLGLSIAGFGYQRGKKIDISDHTAIIQETAFQELEKMQIEQVYDLWKAFRNLDLLSTRKAPHLKARAEYNYFRNAMLAGFAVAAAGLASTGLSLAGGTKNS